MLIGLTTQYKFIHMAAQMENCTETVAKIQVKKIERLPRISKHYGRLYIFSTDIMERK